MASKCEGPKTLKPYDRCGRCHRDFMIHDAAWDFLRCHICERI